MNTDIIRNYAALIRYASTLIENNVGDEGVGLYLPAVTIAQAHTMVRRILDIFQVTAPNAVAGCQSSEQLESAFDSYLITGYDDGYYFELVCEWRGRTVFMSIDKQSHEWSSPMMISYEFGLGDRSSSAWNEYEDLVREILSLCDSCVAGTCGAYALFGETMDVMASDSHLDGWIATLSLGESAPSIVVSVNPEQIDFREN